MRPGIDRASARVLLVGGVGFLVPQLHAIENAVWEERPRTAPPGGTPLYESALVEVGADGERRMLPHIDLATILG